VYAIIACAVQNLDRNYRNIYIPSDRQPVIKALGNHQIISKLFWDCHQSLIQLATHTKIYLIWVTSDECTVGNETAISRREQDLNIRS
jgi:hypothetical protein